MMKPMTDTPGHADGPLENWFLLMDPAWRPVAADEAPPAEAVVGLWPVEDGVIGRFRPNPDYVPADENSPTDPLDLVLRLMLAGQAETWRLRLMVRDSRYDVAMNGDGTPLVTTSPDGVPCVVVATAEPHRRRLRVPDWQQVDLGELVELLADGVDVLFNPGGPATTRLTGDFLRETTLLDQDEFPVEGIEGLRITPWEAGARD
jgi:hypothetical protein